MYRYYPFVIREQFTRRFTKSVEDLSNSHQIPDIWVFLDCVLDESFQKLKTLVTIPGFEPNSKLVSTIVERCPELQMLDLTFELMEKKEIWPKEKLEPLILPLSSLHRLRSLTLSYLDQSQKLLLRLIGKSCPSLKYLKVLAYNSITAKEIVLAVVLGELIDQLVSNWSEELPEWFKDETLWGLRIPPKYLTPLCSTLSSFIIHVTTELEDGDIETVKDSTGAFTLRHLPFLQILDMGYSMAPGGVKLLYDSGRTAHLTVQTGFDDAVRNAATATQLISANVPALKLLSSLAASGKSCGL